MILPAYVYVEWSWLYNIRNKPYIGETSRPLKKRIYEHKQALLKKDTSYALVLHRNSENIILI